MSEPDTDYFSSLRGEKHMSLTTFRRNGEPVATPIWFAEVAGCLYVRTAGHFKKLERIAEDPSVTVAPCTENGEVTGAVLTGVARILSDSDPVIEAADAALNRKYPAERPAMTQLLADNGWPGIYVEVRAPAAT